MSQFQLRPRVRYVHMDIEGILREIDAELDKLQRIRSIVVSLSRAAAIKPTKVRRTRVLGFIQTDPTPEPRLIVLPPKRKREYTRRVKPAIKESKALAPPINYRPVFVPKSMKAQPPITEPDRDESALEAAMRQKLLGGAA